MDTICGIGLPELIFLALVGFIVIGPSRSKEVALSAGRLLSRMMRLPWWSDFREISDALRNLPTTLVRMAELEEAQKDIQQTIGDVSQFGSQISADLSGNTTSSANPWGISTAHPEKSDSSDEVNEASE